MYEYGASNCFEYEFINDISFDSDYEKVYLQYNYRNIFYYYKRFKVLENYINSDNYKKLNKLMYHYLFTKNKVLQCNLKRYE